MEKNNRRVRSESDVMQMVESYEQSGLGRAEYCQREGIPVTTLAYYLRRQKTKPPHLVSVTIAENEQSTSSGFVLVLPNGRRIECGWGFAEASLARLLRVAGQA